MDAQDSRRTGVCGVNDRVACCSWATYDAGVGFGPPEALGNAGMVETGGTACGHVPFGALTDGRLDRAGRSCALVVAVDSAEPFLALGGVLVIISCSSNRGRSPSS